MIELRPCPFCGGRAELNEHTGYGWRTVQCVECCASTSEAGVYTAAEAAARWNRRAADQPDAIPCPHPDIAMIDGVCYCCGKPVASTPTPQPAAAPCYHIWVYSTSVRDWECTKCGRRGRTADNSPAAHEPTP